jgi:hypothetical protein
MAAKKPLVMGTSGYPEEIQAADSLAGMTLVALAANATNSAVTAANSNLSFQIGANEVWIMELSLTVQCSGTGGSKFQITAPAGATLEGWLQTSTTGLTVYSSQRITAINTLTATAAHTVAAVPAPDTILVRVKNGATAGTVALGFASVTAAQITTIFAGSFMRAYKAVEV